MKQSALCQPFKHLPFVLRQAEETGSFFWSSLKHVWDRKWPSRPGSIATSHTVVLILLKLNGYCWCIGNLLVFSFTIYITIFYWICFLVFQVCQLILLIFLGRLCALTKSICRVYKFWLSLSNIYTFFLQPLLFHWQEQPVKCSTALRTSIVLFFSWKILNNWVYYNMP